jgi:hypothetical protein
MIERKTSVSAAATGEEGGQLVYRQPWEGKGKPEDCWRMANWALDHMGAAAAPSPIVAAASEVGGRAPPPLVGAVSTSG